LSSNEKRNGEKSEVFKDSYTESDDNGKESENLKKAEQLANKLKSR